MKRSLLFIGALSLLIAGCATPQSQMKRELSEIIVKSDPEVLVVKGGKIEADVTMKIVCEIEDTEEVKGLFTNLTSASAVLVSETTELTKKL